MNNIIKFYPWDNFAYENTLAPVPAVKNIPEYWSKWPRLLENNVMTVKHCMPFFDAMTAGYYYLLPCDINIKIENKIPNITWDCKITPLMIRNNKEIHSPIGYYDIHFSWQMWWGLKLPDGWSALITNPLNDHELPFKTVSGIVDYDKYTAPGNIGFFIQEGFEGTIKKGTPIFQIIPIKRSQWSMEIDLSIQEQGHKDHDKKLSSPPAHYKKEIRVDKRYE